MIEKKNIFNIFILFLITHLLIWTLIPAISNVNLPLDTIEHLAWASNLDWGYSKHPPLVAFVLNIFFKIFGNQDWAYYFLSQLFIIISFFIIYKFSYDFFDSKRLALISVLLLEGIYFYNFTTPEFNVNISQLPFWTLTIYFTWRCIKFDKISDYILLAIFISLGILSKYLFIYLVIGIKLLFIYLIKNDKKSLSNYFIVGPIIILLLLPHIVWLTQNDFKTLVYAFQRTGGPGDFFDHIALPLIFLGKQIGILIPFFIMAFFLIKKFKFKLNLKDKKLIFLFFTFIVPISLIFLTSLVMGVKIRTMWMTPFYLFSGVLMIYFLKNSILITNMNKFIIIFSLFFFVSPIIYLTVSIKNEFKRTDYPGKEIARLVQDRWDKNFINKIEYVIGDEWYAGNLSYHLDSRPKWRQSLEGSVSTLEANSGVIYTGNPKILKEVCPGVFGAIKPVGYCMIGQR